MAKGWDASKNKILASKQIKDVNSDTSEFIVELSSYNGADPKIHVLQKITKKDNSSFIKPATGIPIRTALKIGIAIKKMCKEYLGEE